MEHTDNLTLDELNEICKPTDDCILKYFPMYHSDYNLITDDDLKNVKMNYIIDVKLCKNEHKEKSYSSTMFTGCTSLLTNPLELTSIATKGQLNYDFNIRKIYVKLVKGYMITKYGLNENLLLDNFLKWFYSLNMYQLNDFDNYLISINESKGFDAFFRVSLISFYRIFEILHCKATIFLERREDYIEELPSIDEDGENDSFYGRALNNLNETLRELRKDIIIYTLIMDDYNYQNKKV